MSRYEMPKTISEAAADFREANAAMRKIAKNGGRTAASSNALLRHQVIAVRAMRFILDAGERPAAGFLTEEDHLIENIAKSVTPRPDLKRRLNTVRRDLRCRLDYLEVTSR